MTSNDWERDRHEISPTVAGSRETFPTIFDLVRRQRPSSRLVCFHDWDGFGVLDLGEIEIWDGADLALLRETLTQLVEKKNSRSIGVNMRFVKYIPSGFFGMLYDWHEKGVAVRLYAPQPNVEMMLWFRQFFDQN